MEKWEDKIKARIDGYESTLPEGAVAEFHALRSAGVSGRTKRAFIPIWLIATAAAAGIAALLFLWRPGTAIEPTEAPMPQVPMVAGTAADTTVAVPVSVVSVVSVTIPSVDILIAKADTPDAVAPNNDVASDANPDSSVADATAQTQEVYSTETKEDDVEVFDATIDYKKEASSIKISPTKGGLLIAEVLASVATVFAFGNSSDNMMPIELNEPFKPGLDYYYDGMYYTNIENLYSYPIKFGLSLRIPITDRLSVTTGIDYMRMRHDNIYTVAYYGYYGYMIKKDEIITRAHYLGVPLRIDWTLFSSRIVDLYLGAGIETDYCFSATETWNENPPRVINKDNWHLSAIATTGVQANLTKHFGIYLEPGIAWNLTPGYNVLDNYRSRRTVMFSLATGVRFTL